MSAPFHTFVLSDIHLADAELGHPGSSLWKRYKRPKFFIDQSFKRLLRYLEKEIGDEPAELVLNGDIFDFDSVMRLPKKPEFHISWLESKRGLFPEEKKSRFKMETILADHPVWVNALRQFIQKGHSVVFIIGNHDVELHWPLVQREILKSLRLSEVEESRVRFCEWFYISNQDTAIEHGNQYDDYSVTKNPIHPLIKKGKRIQVRLPFGNIAGRYIMNGMGLFNPHVESSFLMEPKEYIQFLFKYAIKAQPFLLFNWLWGAIVSFWEAMTDGLLPALRDPLFAEQRVQEIAKKANATPEMVRTMNELAVHTAIHNPIKIAQELWLDRFILLLVIAFISFHLYAMIYMISSAPAIWFGLIFALLVPVLIYYSKSIKSNVMEAMEESLKHVPMIAHITKTKRIIFGHTHREQHTMIDQVEVLNTGTWSPAFKDPECKVVMGQACFAWIRAKTAGHDSDRIADLYSWDDPGIRKLT